MNVAILGNGYISRYLSKALIAKHNVTICSRDVLDYGNKEILSQFIKNSDVNIVVCAFGFTGNPNIDEAEEKKSLCWKLNVLNPLMVNTVCSDLNVAFCSVSSGCIYDGYDKLWTKDDPPNFGIFHESSFYSKSKHAFETVTSHLPGTVIRIRMPFSSCMSNRNYLKKLLGYSKLVDMKNSRTSVDDLCSVVEASLDLMFDEKTKERRIMQIVNPEPLTTKEVITIMCQYGLLRNDWIFIPIEELPVKAPRSNCLLEVDACSFGHLIRNESDAMERSIMLMAQNVL